ncbi:DNA polymerase IV, partial [Halomonas sp. BC04]
MNPIRKILHADCDCFYAAVEMRDNPALREIPL